MPTHFANSVLQCIFHTPLQKDIIVGYIAQNYNTVSHRSHVCLLGTLQNLRIHCELIILMYSSWRSTVAVATKAWN